MAAARAADADTRGAYERGPAHQRNGAAAELAPAALAAGLWGRAVCMGPRCRRLRRAPCHSPAAGPAEARRARLGLFARRRFLPVRSTQANTVALPGTNVTVAGCIHLSQNIVMLS